MAFARYILKTIILDLLIKEKNNIDWSVLLMIKILTKTVLIILIFLVSLFAQELPYPPSQIVKGIEWDQNSISSFGKGSDQWPLTWADDGYLYAGWGDGWGWQKSDDKERKRSIGITRIIGDPPDLQGQDLWGDGPGQNFGKPDALIAINEKIILYFTRGDSNYDDDTYLAVSLDSGKTWNLGDERLFSQAPAGFRVRGVCQFGKGYQEARDDYLYVYFGMNRHPDIYLARVPISLIDDEFQYEWFLYRNPDGTAQWTRNFSRRAVVFHDNNGYGWHVSVVFHPGLDRILLTKPHYNNDDDRETIYLSKSGINGLGIFDAPNPWGSWTTIYYNDNFLDEFVKFNYIIPAKFINVDSEVFWMAWSGWPQYDNISFIKGRFLLMNK